jgi:broad specificity phosphatase PhoE
MRTLVLVRHGETVGNSSIRYHGRTDVELSDLGRSQMRAAGRWLRAHLESPHFTAVIASPLRRASEGASIIVGVDAPIVEIGEFVEVDFGRFEGLTAEEIRERYPADFERWNRDRLNPAFTYPEGESRADFTKRTERGIRRMLELIDRTASPPRPASHEPANGDAALVVAHRGVIRIIANRLAGVEPQIELGSIHILQRTTPAGPWRAKSIDIVEHLSALQI